jgi:hypothetical protein
MDNLKIQATLGKQDTDQRQTKQFNKKHNTEN